jgi:hypothetical protein
LLQCGPKSLLAAKGEEYLQLISIRISNFLVELAEAEVDEYFPHQSKIEP